MSKATRPLGPFTLSGPSRTVQFDTIKDVARYLAKHRIPASSLMGEEAISANPLLYDAPLYRLTDECGLIVPHWQIQGAVKQASEEEMRSWRRKFRDTNTIRRRISATGLSPSAASVDTAGFIAVLKRNPSCATCMD